MRQEYIDSLVDTFVEEERSLSVNPFLATRILGGINKETTGQRRLIPVWQGVAMALSFAFVTALGIKAGNLYKPANSHSNATTVMIMNDDTMEHFEFYQQTLKE